MANRKIDVSVSGGEIYTKLTAERDLLRRQLAEFDEVLCVTCGYNIEFVGFEGEGKRAICRRCQAKLDKAMDYINDLADSGFEKARGLKKEIEGMK